MVPTRYRLSYYSNLVIGKYRIIRHTRSRHVTGYHNYSNLVIGKYRNTVNIDIDVDIDLFSIPYNKNMVFYIAVNITFK